MNKTELQSVIEYSSEILTRPSSFGHSLDHIKRVIKNAHLIVEKMNLHEIDMNLLEAACYLHDLPVILMKPKLLGPIEKHFWEKWAVKKYMPQILDNFSLKESERDILFNACYNHPFSYWGRLNRDKDLYSKVLQDADSLDGIANERIGSYKDKKASLYYKLAFIFSGPYIWFYRKYIRSFLNFPEIAKDLRV